MRLPYRNKKATLWLIFAIVVVTMFLFKYTELRPICFFRDESSSAVVAAGQSGVMVRRFEVSVHNFVFI